MMFGLSLVLFVTSIAATEVYKTPAVGDQTGICLDEECTQILSLETVPKHTTFLTSPLHDFLTKTGLDSSEEESSSTTPEAKEWFFTKVRKEEE